MNQPISPVLSGERPARCLFARATHKLPLLVVVEGVQDIEFLKQFSRLLHADGPRLPDLANLERTGRLVFIPAGGGDLKLWTHRLASLGGNEFHLYDREAPPLSFERQQAVDAINRRPGCLALLTKKRTMENYLHGEAVREACGTAIAIDDCSDVAVLLAQHFLAVSGRSTVGRALAVPTKATGREGKKEAAHAGSCAHEPDSAGGSGSRGRGHRLAEDDRFFR